MSQVGPRLNFSTAWSANAVSIFRSCGLSKVVRAECSRRFRLRSASGTFPLNAKQLTTFAAEVCSRPTHVCSAHASHRLLQVHDRMTECVYTTPLQSFATQITPKPVITIPVMKSGQAALEAINKARRSKHMFS